MSFDQDKARHLHQQARDRQHALDNPPPKWVVDFLRDPSAFEFSADPEAEALTIAADWIDAVVGER